VQIAVMSTIVQLPDSLSFAGNLKKFQVTSVVDVVFQLFQGGTTLMDEVLSPDDNNLVEIDIKSVVEKLLSVAVPSDNSILTEQVAAVKLFNWDIDGTAGSFTALFGGVSDLQETVTTFVQGHWLSWMPQEIDILQSGLQWLDVYATEALNVKVKAYFQDETSETITLVALPANKHYSINVSWGTINANTVKDDPVIWDVWIETTGGTVRSYTQRFKLRNEGDQEHSYVFVNTIGGIDTAIYTGVLISDKKHKHKTAELAGGIINEFENEQNPEHKQQTGYLDSDQGAWLSDFFNSPSRYRVDTGGTLKQIAIDSSKVVSSSGDDQFNYEFTFKYGEDSKYLNLDRASGALPAPEGPADFFSAELLSGLPVANYAANLQIAVQSPAVQGWQVLTMAQLWGGALPNLVDGVSIVYQDGVLKAVGAAAEGHGHAFADLLSKPTTIAGFGITDAYTKTEVNASLATKLNTSGNQSMAGVLTITGLNVNGPIIQNGAAYETHAQKVFTTNDYITLRDGAVGGLAVGAFAGFEAKLYDGTNDGRLVFDNTGTARVGDVGNEIPLMGRSEIGALINGNLLQWQLSGMKAIDSGISAASYNNANWNTAYGWGDHAGLYRDAAWIPTWAELSKPTWESKMGWDGTKVTISTPLKVTGSIEATDEVWAYAAGAVSSNVLANLVAQAPLYKVSDDVIGLRYNISQFEINGSNELQIQSGVLAPASHSHVISDVAGLQTALNGKEDSHSHPYRPDTWVPTFSQITSKPTTLSGYGITDVYTKTDSDGKYALTHSHPYLSSSDTRIANWDSHLINNSNPHNISLTQLGYTGATNANYYTHPSTHLWSIISNPPVYSTRWAAWSEVTGKPEWESKMGWDGAKVTISAPLAVTGSIEASDEVWSYAAGAVSSSVLANLIAQAPLYKVADDIIGMRYDISQFELNGSNELKIKDNVLAPASHSMSTHSDLSSYFTGYNAINALSLGGNLAANYARTDVDEGFDANVQFTTISGAGNVITPLYNGTYDFGSGAARWKTIFATTIDTTPDGTSANWKSAYDKANLQPFYAANGSYNAHYAGGRIESGATFAGTSSTYIAYNNGSGWYKLRSGYADDAGTLGTIAATNYARTDITEHFDADIYISGYIYSNSITTGLKQVIVPTASTIYVGNYLTTLKLESDIDPTIKVGSNTYSFYHSGNSLYIGANKDIDSSDQGYWWSNNHTNDTNGTHPANYTYEVNFGGSGTGRGLQLATSYGFDNNGFWIRRRSDNASSENGANVWQDWKQLYHSGNSNLATVNWTANALYLYDRITFSGTTKNIVGVNRIQTGSGDWMDIQLVGAGSSFRIKDIYGGRTVFQYDQGNDYADFVAVDLRVKGNAVYHSGNSNLDTVDWTAKDGIFAGNITSNGNIYAKGGTVSVGDSSQTTGYDSVLTTNALSFHPNAVISSYIDVYRDQSGSHNGRIDMRSSYAGANHTSMAKFSYSTVILYAYGNEKLATTSSGVDVAGTLSATTFSGANVTSGINPGHTHTNVSISALDTSAITTGIFSVSRGGTGAGSFTSNALLTGNGTSAIQAETGLTYNASVLNVVGEVRATSEVYAFYSASDRDLKKNVENLSGSNILRHLRPISFEYNDLARNMGFAPVGRFNSFIAQEVQGIMPQAVAQLGNTRYLRLREKEIIAPLVAGWKEHDTRLNHLESIWSKPENELEMLKRKVQELESEIQYLKSIAA
jgi:hypothetical protein